MVEKIWNKKLLIKSETSPKTVNYMAITNFGKGLIGSEDGIKWFNLPAPPFEILNRAIDYNDVLGTWIISVKGQYATSTDGYNWTVYSTPDAAFGDFISCTTGKYIYMFASASRNTVYWTTNLTRWTSARITSTSNWRAAAYSESFNKTMVVGSSAAAGYVSGTSGNSISSSGTLPSDVQWSGIVVVGDTAYAYGENPDESDYSKSTLAYTLDGKAWNATGVTKGVRAASYSPKIGAVAISNTSSSLSGFGYGYMTTTGIQGIGALSGFSYIGGIKAVGDRCYLYGNKSGSPEPTPVFKYFTSSTVGILENLVCPAGVTTVNKVVAKPVSAGPSEEIVPPFDEEDNFEQL